jgi:acetyl-CoA C-acetyltransferase
MSKSVILSAARTPIGKLDRAIASVDATTLGATAISAALRRADVGPEQVEHLVMGQVLQAGRGRFRRARRKSRPGSRRR